MVRPLAPPVPVAAGPWAWAVMGAIVGLLVALVAFAPARWAAAAISRNSGGRVLIQDTRGTVWNGSGQLVLTGGAGSRDAATLPSRLEWRLRPGLGGMRLQLGADCCTRQPLVLRLQPGWRGGAVTLMQGPPSQWPAGLLTGLGTPWNTLRLDGELQLSSPGLSLRWVDQRLQVSGRADVEALRLGSQLTTVRPMGSYRLTLQDGGTPTLQLQTIEGSLRLTGSGQWVGSRLRFQGEATAEPDREAALANLLNIIGRRSGARSIITIG